MIILSGNLNTEGRFVSFTSMNLIGEELGHSTNTVINISFIFFCEWQVAGDSCICAYAFVIN